MLTDGVSMSIPAKMEKNIWFGKWLRGVVVVIAKKKNLQRDDREQFRGEKISRKYGRNNQSREVKVARRMFK